jgi:hypothetical protein
MTDSTIVEKAAEAIWKAEWARAGNRGQRRVPWTVPVALSDPVPAGPGAAVLQRFLPGGPHPPHEGDPAVLRGVLDTQSVKDRRQRRSKYGAKRPK